MPPRHPEARQSCFSRHSRILACPYLAILAKTSQTCNPLTRRVPAALSGTSRAARRAPPVAHASDGLACHGELALGLPPEKARRSERRVDDVNASDRPISVPRVAGNPGPSNRALRRTRWRVRPAQHPSPTVQVLAPASPAPQRSTRRTRRAQRPLPAAASAIATQ